MVSKKFESLVCDTKVLSPTALNQDQIRLLTFAETQRYLYHRQIVV